MIGLVLCGLIATANAAKLPAAVLDALGNTNHKAAISRLEAASSAETDGTAKAWDLLYLGELERLSNDAGARAHFQAVAGDYPASGAKNAALLGMALVDANGTASGNTRSTLELLSDDGVPDTMNADRWLLIAAARKGEGATAARVTDATEKATKFAASDPAVQKRVARSVASISADLPPAGAMAADDAAIEKIRSSLREGDLATVTQLATAFSTKYPTSAHGAEAQTAAARAAAGKPPDYKRIAVLLPLTGQYAQPASGLKSAIEQAGEHLGGTYTIAFYDTAGTPDQCVKSLQKAVIEDGATIVLGPLTKEEAAQCAPAAQLLHTAMLPLTSSADVVAAGDQVFRPYPTSEDQVHALLSETLDHRGIKTYAIVHPKTAYGENAARAFVDGVTAGGGSITANIGYEPTTADFRSFAKQLNGKAFDAIFLPDTYQNVALLAAAIASQEISVGGFQKVDSDPAVPLLGLNGWHNDEIVRRGGIYVQQAIFVDAFDPHALDPAVVKFVANWKGDSPPNVLDAVGYDATLLAAGALAAGGDAATALGTVEIKDGVAGTSGFDGNRDAKRDWRLLTITKQGIGPLPAYVPPTP